MSARRILEAQRNRRNANLCICDTSWSLGKKAKQTECLLLGGCEIQACWQDEGETDGVLPFCILRGLALALVLALALALALAPAPAPVAAAAPTSEVSGGVVGLTS